MAQLGSRSTAVPNRKTLHNIVFTRPWALMLPKRRQTLTRPMVQILMCQGGLSSQPTLNRACTFRLAFRQQCYGSSSTFNLNTGTDLEMPGE